MKNSKLHPAILEDNANVAGHTTEKAPTQGVEPLKLVQKFVVPAMKAALEHIQPLFAAMSALLTTTMLAMRTTIEALKQAGLRDRVTVLVGAARHYQ